MIDARVSAKPHYVFGLQYGTKMVSRDLTTSRLRNFCVRPPIMHFDHFDEVKVMVASTLAFDEVYFDTFPQEVLCWQHISCTWSLGGHMDVAYLGHPTRNRQSRSREPNSASHLMLFCENPTPDFFFRVSRSPLPA